MNELTPSELLHEVEITYSTQALTEKLKSYALNPETAYTKPRVDLNALHSVEKNEGTQTNLFFLQLCEALRQWPQTHNVESFTVHINQLIFLWLNAIQDGANTQAIINLLKCVQLKPGWGAPKSAQLHLFLFDLLTDTLHQHQQLELDYVVNFDANTKLANINQMIPNINIAAKQTSNQQLIGLFSLNFQTFRNKLALSKFIALELNKQIASVLQQNIPANCSLYFAGDSQFDIIIPKITDTAQLNLLAAKISRAFEEMLFLSFQSILVTPYIGCAFAQTGTKSAQDLYNNSKMALESAINSQQHFVIYSEALQEKLIEQNNVEAKVLEAFGSDNLTLFFQPIVNLKNGKCTGAELLLRWSEKFGYNVYPSLTIEILNKVGKGKLFTRWLINSACRYASELKYEHSLKVYLTINLRAEDLYDTELPHLLSQAVALWKLDSKDIILEITENGILEYNESTTSVINQLAEIGFRFALDDFGTGFSSLSRLRTMPIDLIKIDQSFVRHITESKEDFEIVQSIAQLAKGLGKEVLAEGVEDEAALAVIKKMKIDKCQGYFYAKPMPFEQFIDWAKAH